jgi:hypothetical protein
LGGFLTLDALLAAALFERTGDLEQAHSALPLAQTGGMWHASAALLEAPTQYRATLTASLHARHDIAPELLRRGRGGVLPRIGEKRRREYGNVQNPVEGFAATAVWWFAEGDPKEVETLLQGVRHVGKKHTAGYGEVGHRDIEPVDTVNGVLDLAGYPLRPIPGEIYKGKGDAVVADAAWRPAYWKLENRAKCYVPERTRYGRDELGAML